MARGQPPEGPAIAKYFSPSSWDFSPRRDGRHRLQAGPAVGGRVAQALPTPSGRHRASAPLFSLFAVSLTPHYNKLLPAHRG